ncbi:MAG: hypothetical protein MZV63_45325 [Marinilabiliales bacterium]|nr:hypothetical protein [Marinilabiliales bacterium]
MPCGCWNRCPGTPADEAEKYLTEDVVDVDDALAGARDIIAEMVSENEQVRGNLRILYEQ